MITGFVGMGNMGFALMKGLLKQKEPQALLFSCKRREHGHAVSEKTGVPFLEENVEVAKRADLILLAVKPIVYREVLQEIAPVIRENQMVVSLAPGVTISDLSEQLKGFRRIVRAMPNTPAMVSEGATGIACDWQLFTTEEREEVNRLFSGVGRVFQVEERLMNAVTVVSGSSPALIYELIDTLADAALRYGMKKSDALQMAAQAVLGSARMVLESGEHPAVLRDRVCSPGGTTIEEMAALAESGFRASVLKGAEACYQACKGKA